MSAPQETIVDSSDMVLVLIDFQERLAAVMPEKERVLGVTSRLLKGAALIGAPVLVTRQYPQGLGSTEPLLEQLLIELADEGARVTGVDKTAFCCMLEPTFVEALEGTGRRQVVIAGLETHICVTQTALAIAGSGYQVQVVADACSSRDNFAHEVALDRLRATNVIVTHSESVLYEAVGKAGTKEFKSLLALIKGQSR